MSNGYEVHGLIRRASTLNTSCIDRLYADPHSTDACLFCIATPCRRGATNKLRADIDLDEG
ncbi:MAG: hypothetical protein AB1925_17690 [Actinomycetota bacterium]